MAPLGWGLPASAFVATPHRVGLVHDFVEVAVFSAKPEEQLDELDFLQQLHEHYAERVQYIPFTWAELEAMLTRLEGANVFMHRDHMDHKI